MVSETGILSGFLGDPKEEGQVRDLFQSCEISWSILVPPLISDSPRILLRKFIARQDVVFVAYAPLGRSVGRLWAS